MQTIDGHLVYSATDLVGFLACEHLTNLDRAATAGLVHRPMRVDAELDRIAKRGVQHEERFLAELLVGDITVTRIEPDASIPDPGGRLKEAVERTVEAIRRGDEVIYQAALFDGRLRGHPDFLIKVDRPSNLGNWSYEVWDTKLARSAKGSAVLQICAYSDLLAQVQGSQPQLMHLALAGSKAETISLRVADYSAYFRLVRVEFEGILAGNAAAYPPETRPDPVEHCDVCRWSEVCRKARRTADDLSLVAGITARQRRLLRERDIPTRTALASLTLPLSPPLGGTSSQSLSRVREQARIQVEGDAAGQVLSELLAPARTRGGELEANRGLLSLPAPSPGDLFFDIEGDPFALDDGVDYLFGVLEPRLTDENGQPVFHSYWSIDSANEVTPDAERAAFEALIDLVMDRLTQDPDLHVYHYAPYEPTAVRRLMGRYGTREDEVDRLLRGGVFVDLFRAVRQGVRASVESYSIKRLEPLYDFERTVDLRDAGSSIVAFETWLELGGEVEGDAGILERIEGYNRDDCVSTWMLRGWLEQQRAQLAQELGEDPPRPQSTPGEPGEELGAALAQTVALAERLCEGVPDDVALRTPESQGRWLLAQLLSWHRREAKSTWWRYFYLMNDLTDEERIGEPDAMGGLVPEGPVRDEKKSIVYRFRFPPQEHKIGVSTQPRDPATGKAVGEVVAVDDEEGTIEIKRGKKSEPPTAVSLVPLDYVSTADLEGSIHRTGGWTADNSINAPGSYRAVRALLMREPPDIGQTPGSSLLNPGEPADEAARRLVLQLNSSYLAIQGPPGSGKTSVGAEMIVDLVAAGKRVGVTANSHKVIGHLLAKAAEVADARGQRIAIGQKPGQDEGCTYDAATPLAAGEVCDALTQGDVNVVGGTCWLWCREDMRDAVDVLFVDEAGQMSLANVIAAAPAASSIVLLGDPQQLDQLLQGVHPPGADRSALAHLLGGHQTMPAELGLFLDGTWRLHPEVCAYTSEVFYEGRLHPRSGCEHQEVIGQGQLAGSGIRFISVDHHGNDTASEAEASEIDRLVAELMTASPTWIDTKGEEHPLAVDGVLVVTPYNAQVRAIASMRPSIRVGTVDKFQGQEAPISIYSMATSSAEEAPRGMEFLYSLNRLNVATSRARCLAVVVASPHLIRVRCRTPRQMQLANALARLVEMSRFGE